MSIDTIFFEEDWDLSGIFEDENAAPDQGAAEFDQFLHTLEQESAAADAEVERLDTLLQDVDTAQIFIDTTEMYGYHPANVLMMRELLVDTAIVSMGLESFGEPMLANDKNWVVAREDILGGIAETIGGWLKAAANIVTGLIGRVLKIITWPFKKLFELFGKIKDVVGSALSKVTETITDHPIQVLTLAVASAAAVPAVVGLIMKMPLPAASSQVLTWITTAQKAITNSSFGKFFKVQFKGAKMFLNKKLPTNKKGPPSALGWTGDKIRGLFSSALRLFGKNGPVRSVLGTIKTWVTNAFKYIKKKDSSILEFSNTRKSVVGKALGWMWRMFRDGYTTCLGLLLTAGSKIWSSISKIKKRNKEKEEAAAAAQSKSQGSDASPPPSPAAGSTNPSGTKTTIS